MKLAVVVPHGGFELATETRESVIRYCERFGLDAVFLPENKINATGPGKYKYGRFEKFQVRGVFERYDRLMLIDSDTLLTDLAPNVFEIVDPDCLGVVREDVLKIAANRRREIRAVQTVMGDLNWHEEYFNSGVVVASRQHAELWNVDDEMVRALKNKNLGRHKEQKIVNWRAKSLGFDIQWLDPRWNYLRMYESQLGLPRTNSFLIHYAGRKNRNALRSVDAKILKSRHFYDKRCQMRPDQIEWIIRQAGTRLGGKVLYFGSGYDSLMWSKVCDVTFLEDSSKWYRRLFENPDHQSIKAYLVNYNTRVENWPDELANNTLNTLPIEINLSEYDAIIIDGPRGSRPSSPGRVSPILHAKRLLKKGGVIFVDDVSRKLESNVTAQVLGKPTATHKSRSKLGCWTF